MQPTPKVCSNILLLLLLLLLSYDPHEENLMYLVLQFKISKQSTVILQKICTITFLGFSSHVIAPPST